MVSRAFSFFSAVIGRKELTHARVFRARRTRHKITAPFPNTSSISLCIPTPTPPPPSISPSPAPPFFQHKKKVPEAELELETPRFFVRIRIRGTKCRLLGPDLPELRSLLGAPGMGAGRLIMELERAGKEIRLSPVHRDSREVPISLPTLHKSTNYTIKQEPNDTISFNPTSHQGSVSLRATRMRHERRRLSESTAPTATPLAGRLVRRGTLPTAKARTRTRRTGCC